MCMPVETTGERSGLLKNGKKKKLNDYDTGIPQHGMEALAHVLLPEIEKFCASEEGQRQFAQWQAEQVKSQKAK